MPGERLVVSLPSAGVRDRTSSSRAVKVAGLVGAVAVLLAFGVGQLVLPGIARDRLRDRLAQHGRVERVEVHAVPAIKLLWGDADRVVVRMRTYRSSLLPGLARRLGVDGAGRPGELADRLASTSGTGRLDATAAEFDVGPLRLTQASLEKRGAKLTGTATLSKADLHAALPNFLRVRRVSSGRGALRLSGTLSAFGRRLTTDFILAARGGKLVLTPDVALGGLATVVLFGDPRVRIEDVAVRPLPGRYVISATATVP